MLRPVTPEQFHDRRMVDVDGRLQNDQQLRRETRPAFPEDHVVGVLNTQARGTTNQVERIQQFLYFEKRDVPRAFWPGERGFPSIGSVAMSSPRARATHV